MKKKNLPIRYSLNKQISEGWSSKIYDGFFITNVEESVVFKHLKKEINGQNTAQIKKHLIEAMIKECLALKVLEHNAFVPNFYELLWVDNRPCIIMEKIQGLTLEQYVQSNKLSWIQIKEIATSLLNILTDIHNANFIHCDLNPSNIIIGDNNNIYLIDFGAVQFQNIKPYWSYPLGRHRFMPPEYLLERHMKKPYENLDITCDLYQIACLIYFLITGKEPFRRPTENEDYQTDFLDNLGLFMNLPTAEKIKRLEISTSKEIVNFLSKALESLPSKRFQNVEEMLNSLKIL